MESHSDREDAVVIRPVQVRVVREECGCVIWKFRFDDAWGFEPDEAGVDPIMFWRMATGTSTDQLRLVSPPKKKRRNPFYSDINVRGPSGHPHNPIVDASTGVLVLAGRHPCRGGHDVYEARHWSSIARELRRAFAKADRPTLLEVEVRL